MMNNFPVLPPSQMDPSLLSQRPQSLSNPNNPIQDSMLPQYSISMPSKPKIPSWSKFHLKWFAKGVNYSASVIMDHYLIVLAQDKSRNINDPDYKRNYDPTGDEPPCLLAFNLLDHSVQRAEINKYLFEHQEGYSFLKYGNNQIIKYGGRTNYSSVCNLACITVKSFERILLILSSNKMPDAFSSQYTAQIYLDYLLVYGPVRTSYNRLGPDRVITEFWWFDLKKRVWELRKTTGEAPKLDNAPRSSISQFNLYVYGVIQDRHDLPDLFVLNLGGAMKWTKISQENEYLQAEDDNEFKRSAGAIYRGHLVTLQRPPSSHKNALCFLDLDTNNTWSTFNIKGINKYKRMSKVQTGGLMMYKNWVVTVTTAGYDQNLVVAMMSIESILPMRILLNFCALDFKISAETSTISNDEAYFDSVFMSQKGSDVAFRVGEQIIPAHKRMLMQKSRYFEKVFNSGMAESTQKIIEVKDCEYEIFTEFLRWIYQSTVKFTSEHQVIKIHMLADQYLQENLCTKCQDFLISILDMDNVCTILEFADRADLVEIKRWSLKCLQDKLSVSNILGLIRFLGDHHEFKENNKDFRDQAFLFILDEFFMIVDHEKGNIQIYEDFIVENIEMGDLPALARFLGGDTRKQRNAFVEIYEEDLENKEEHEESEDEEDFEDKMPPRMMPPISQEFFQRCTSYLRGVVFGFMQQNSRTIITNGMAEALPFGFLKEFMVSTSEELNSSKTELQSLKRENRKRMEPGSSDGEGEGHELKKTKKHDPLYGN